MSFRVIKNNKTGPTSKRIGCAKIIKFINKLQKYINFNRGDSSVTQCREYRYAIYIIIRLIENIILSK